MIATVSIPVGYPDISCKPLLGSLPKSRASHLSEIHAIQALVFPILTFKTTLYNKTNFHDLVTPNTIAL